MHVFIVTSIIASQLAFHNAINRYGLSLAREGVLPKALAKVHPKHRSPYVAGIAHPHKESPLCHEPSKSSPPSRTPS
jgi:amino acid transporter